MKLLIPTEIESLIADALTRAGKREVGGILMGEHVSENTFRVLEITVQMKGGTYATFVRLVEELIGPLRSFFGRTRHQYTRFNYIGEWHSHHSFDLVPSASDEHEMRQLIADSEIGARFVVLLLVKFREAIRLEFAATVYTATGRNLTGEVVLEGR